MDIFSSIRNIQNNTYEKLDVHNSNKSNINRQVEEIQKDVLEKKSKEEIKTELQRVVKELNEAMNPLNTDLTFKFNDKVIREFPTKEALRLMEKMRELVGMLFDKKG